MIERLTLGVFLLSVVLAALTPAPMLLHHNLGYPDRIWPTHPQETAPPLAGTLRVNPTREYGCIDVRTAAGTQTAVVCHRALRCRGAPSARDQTAYEIFKRKDRAGYDVQVCSRCDSGCCDCRATQIAEDGTRLDDSVFERVWNRLDFSWPALVLGLLCAVAIRRGRRGILVYSGLIAGFGIPTLFLWLSL